MTVSWLAAFGKRCQVNETALVIAHVRSPWELENSTWPTRTKTISKFGEGIPKFQDHFSFNHLQALPCAPPRLLLKDPTYPNTQAFATKGPRTARPPLGILVRRHHGPDIEDSSSKNFWTVDFF